MEKIIRLLYTISAIKWSVLFYFKILRDRNFRSNILKNRKLKNIHHKETCVIVGNGPSLKQMDLTPLNDCYVFTVNDIGKNQDLYKRLNSSCHVIVDPYFCNKNDDDLRRFLNTIVNPNKKTRCICRSSLIGNPVLNEFPSIEFTYVYIHNNWDTLIPIRVSMDRNMYQCLNVIQAAICAALFMGFKNIHLIGCEMTSMYEHFEINANNVIKNYHAYEYTDEENNRLQKFSTICDNESILKEYYTDFHIFKKIKKYAISQEAHIYNSTLGGLLDMFPRCDLKNIFKKEEF